MSQLIPLYTVYKTAEEKLKDDGKQKEHFSVLGGFGNLFSIVVFLIAFYLSWSCNSCLNMGTGEKLIRAFVAGIFGILYIIIYFIFFSTDCNGYCGSDYFIIYL